MKLPPPDSEEFLNLPALAPPPGVIPKFENPPSLRQPELAVLQLTLATLAVWMRLYTKQFVVRRMLPEDWWLFAAWIAFAGFHAIVFIMEDLPLGVHQWDITVRSAIRQSKLFQISTALYCIVALPLKVAIILQIRRIVLPRTGSSDPSQRTTTRFLLRVTIDFFIFLNVAFYLALFFFQWLQCRPLRKAWDFRVPGYCTPHHLVLHIISASINTLSDLITVLLPQPVIWKLKMDRKRKIGLSAVFALGGLACIASAVRLFYAVRLNYTADLTFVAGQMGKWVEPELTFGFLAACLPVAPAFVKHVRRGIRRLRGQPLSTDQSYTSRENGKRSYAYGGGSKGKVIGHGSARKGEITKCVETDIEFSELTRERSQEALVGEGFTTASARASARTSSEDGHGVEAIRLPESSYQMKWA
ncbi:hypothetical protein BKA63DRAFT_282814 [Paraphoma chrysanthemicola]|nr:hypothetical protein BKA63DRAFT_282814 [Paraphoma chrysanthemicola]